MLRAFCHVFLAQLPTKVLGAAHAQIQYTPRGEVGKSHAWDFPRLTNCHFWTLQLSLLDTGGILQYDTSIDRKENTFLQNKGFYKIKVFTLVNLTLTLAPHSQCYES